ncbi:MAG TPA: hypothetical protein VM576_06050 [Xanthomonadaceae bacterium]|jgi:multidrug transporter EmrE-like cation transporter|nr:hypothetical protein [Xanthomonadaceae bacterium]
MLSQPPKALDHVWILATILFTVSSQLLIKWQVGLAGTLPASTHDRVVYVASLFLRPWVIVAVASTFMAGVTWMIALGKFDLSYAFPFSALTFPLVLAAGFLFFAEPVTMHKLVGLALIMIGVAVIGAGPSQ